MIQNDAELIQRVLQGDEDAFGCLVKKYQKGVHALAWRKIGDFHQIFGQETQSFRFGRNARLLFC